MPALTPHNWTERPGCLDPFWNYNRAFPSGNDRHDESAFWKQSPAIRMDSAVNYDVYFGEAGIALSAALRSICTTH